MITRSGAGLFALCTGAAVIVGLVWARPGIRRDKLVPLHIAVHPAEIVADGYDTAVLNVDSELPPRVSVVEGIHGAAIAESRQAGDHWEVQVRAGVVPGRVVLQVNVPDRPVAAVSLVITASFDDTFQDGTPDFLRLDQEADQQSFRRWFTFLAEEQFLQAPSARAPEIDDCAALIRYAYREALHIHDSAWADSARLPLVPALGAIAKYQYPYTPLGAALFRTRAGLYAPSDATNGNFAQFADAQTLWRFNTHLVGRDLARALPGDLIFYRQESGHMPFHSMIYLGASQFHRDGRVYVLYHTGPDGSDPGEIKRLTVPEILQFPQPEWRPTPENPAFLGVFRWNILRKASERS